MLGRAARTQLGPVRDPVRRLRKRLAITSEALVKLEHAVELIVSGAVDKAVASKTATEKETPR
jgi:hypothetical protein